MFNVLDNKIYFKNSKAYNYNSKYIKVKQQDQVFGLKEKFK